MSDFLDMSDNYFVWSTVESTVSRYMVMDDAGNSSPDPLLRPIVERKLIALRKFYFENGLLTVKAFDDDGNHIDREYYKNDITDEGLELIRNKRVGSWLNSKASQKDPPDMKLLEKALTELRAGK